MPSRRKDRPKRLFQRAASPSLKGRGIDAAATLRVAGPRRWFWPAATATMTAATLFLATMLVWQRAAQTIAAKQRTPLQPTTAVAAPPAQSEDATGSITPAALQAENFGWPMVSPPTTGYLGLRYIALTRGVGELETHNRTANLDSDSSGDAPATQRELLRELLPAADRRVSPRS